MSFAERNNTQGIVYVEIDNNKDVNIEKIEFEAPVNLLSIPDKPAEPQIVLDLISQLPDGEPDRFSPYLELKIQLSQPEPSLRHNIEEALKGKNVRLARINATTAKEKTERKVFTFEHLNTINPMDIASDIYKRKYGSAEMPAPIRDLLEKVIKDVSSKH